MSSVEQYRPSGGLSTYSSGNRLSRAVGREVSHISAGVSVQLARIESAAEIQASTADAVTFVGRRAMEDVALISQVETQLAEAVPHASGRLAMIADLTAVGLGGVVSDTLRTVRRV